MDLTAPGTGALAASAVSARGWVPATTLLGAGLISLTGLVWDIQWHTDVGPDTFFTVPHLFIYAGAALSGLVSLIVVLATTAAQRAGRPVDPTVGGRAVGVFGSTFAAPIGYLVTGVGAASFLLYGLWDLWWHSLYGFDAVIDSPPHIGLLLSGTVTMVGSIMVFAAARHEPWGPLGLCAAVAVLLIDTTVTAIGFEQLNGQVNAVDAATAVLTVMLVLLVAGFRRRPGGMVLTAGMVAVLQAVYWWFAPWATRAYAGAVDLPVRDYTDGVPAMPALVPMALLLVAAVLELVLRPTRRWLPLVAGGLAGLLISVSTPVQRMLVYDAPAPDVPGLLPTVVTATVLGVLAGHVGWRLGGMLRLLAEKGQ